MTPDSENGSSDVSVSALNGRKNTSKKNLLDFQALLSHQPMPLGICLNAQKNNKKENHEVK